MDFETLTLVMARRIVVKDYENEQGRTFREYEVDMDRDLRREITYLGLRTGESPQLLEKRLMRDAVQVYKALESEYRSKYTQGWRPGGG